jgi:uncharacterized protein YeaC (DUF1315 family)
MIVKISEIYNEVSQELNLSKAIVESIGVEVLSSLRDKLNSPTEIAYELPKLGTFAMHLSKYTSFHQHLLKALETGKWKLGTDYCPEMYERNLILMSKIDEFYKQKNDVKALKHEKKTRESSQDESEECGEIS